MTRAKGDERPPRPPKPPRTTFDVPGYGGDVRHHPANPCPPSPPPNLIGGLVDYLCRAYRAGEAERRRFVGPVKLTKRQAELLLEESRQAKPDNWEDTATVGATVGTVLSLPTVLVAAVEESTPWAHGWRPTPPAQPDPPKEPTR